MAWENLLENGIFSVVYKFYNVYNISQRGKDLVAESGFGARCARQCNHRAQVVPPERENENLTQYVSSQASQPFFKPFNRQIQTDS